MESLLSVKQAAFILKVHPLTIRRYIREKKLKAVKVGGNIRIAEKELENLHKEVEIIKLERDPLLRVKKSSAKQFSEEDPLLRLKGRASSLKLT